MEETPHSSVSWKLEWWSKSLSIIFSLIVANVKNNYYYKIWLYFNCQFSQFYWFHWFHSYLVESFMFAIFPPLIGCFRITQGSVLSFPSRLSQPNQFFNEDAWTAIGHCNNMCKTKTKIKTKKNPVWFLEVDNTVKNWMCSFSYYLFLFTLWFHLRTP